MRLASILVGITLVLFSIPFIKADEGQLQITLSGDWSGTAPDGTEVSYSFSKPGTVIWRVKEEKFTRAWPEGLKAKYQVTVGKPLYAIDIYDFSDPKFKDIRFRGILEVIDGQSFKMEGAPTKGGRGQRSSPSKPLCFGRARSERGRSARHGV